MPREGVQKSADAVKTSSQDQKVSVDKTQVNQCIGVSRGGRSTKIHAAVDALGNPIAIMLSTGNTADITVAEKLISQIDFKGSTILADRTYTKREFREFITNHGADYCIPPRGRSVSFCCLHSVFLLLLMQIMIGIKYHYNYTFHRNNCQGENSIGYLQKWAKGLK